MAKLKRKSKPSRVSKAKKKTHKNKVLKKKAVAKARPAAKKAKPARKPLRKVLAKKIPAPAKPIAGKAAAKPAGKPEEKKWVMHFDEFENGLVMNSTNLQLTAMAMGSEETEDWIGKQIVLFSDPNVSFGGKLVGGLRIRAVRKKAPVAPAAPAKRQVADYDEQDSDIPF